ncbi:hypothetical protein TWF481_010963 [Arthrobotrys musiformis]|uniref:F-box domain-containing protein n=1 Tax=Arthrobotrys musiformis TaxID=47236 RepID=A0AAV9VY07_9PEZI
MAKVGIMLKKLWGKKEDLDAAGPPLLPTEILRLIFELFLDSNPPHESVQNFRQTCKLFNQIALKYIYSDVTVTLNEGGSNTGSISNLIECNEDILAHISRLRVTGFPPPPDTGQLVRFIPQKPQASYGTESCETSRSDLKALLEILRPNQLTSFAIVGRQIPTRIDKIPISLLWGKHSNLRQLCIPITLLFQHGVNTAEALGSFRIPSFQSLILTNIQYPRHIADVWALLKISSNTLKSLALKSPDNSELERFIMHRVYLGLTVALPSTEISLSKLQDLHIEGISHLDRFFEDCAPNLVDFSKLRMLRLDRCQRPNAFLLSNLSIYRMPKLKSLQLFQTGSNVALAGFLPAIGPVGLETFVIALDSWDGRTNWMQIKEHLSGSLKRMWIQNSSSYDGPHRVLDMSNHVGPYNDCFFPHGWPKLEELAIDTNYLDGSAVSTPS